MKSFLISWHASGYCGAFNYQVVAESLDKAKIMWDKFVDENKKIKYSWEKAKAGAKNHNGGYIICKCQGDCEKEAGCYELKFDDWGAGSDHLFD